MNRRVYPPFPPRPGSRDPFAESWWGRAWVTALEESSLDAGRLSRGRTYARAGNVDQITVTPGLITAVVHGSRPRPYTSRIRLDVLSADDWDRFLDVVAGRPAHIAALLDKDMPHALVEAAGSAGVRLLPGPGEPAPHCTCPDVGHPCKHAAALCYQTARILDDDPFVLLLMRGREEDDLLDELSRRNAALAARTESAGAAPAPATVGARAALSQPWRPPLPDPLPVPEVPAQPPVFPETDDGPAAESLEFLAVDASARAHAFLSGTESALAPLTPWQDAVRLAAGHPLLAGRHTVSRRFTGLAAATGGTPKELARAAAAWRQGGPEGLAVLEKEWDPPAGDFDRARSALIAAELPRLAPRRNRLTGASGVVQLRYGRDGRWYPYRSDRGRDDWWPEGPADDDPVSALTGLLYA